MRSLGRLWAWLVDDHPAVFAVGLGTAAVLVAVVGWLTD